MTRFLSFSPLQRCMVRVTNYNSARRLVFTIILSGFHHRIVVLLCFLPSQYCSIALSQSFYSSVTIELSCLNHRLIVLSSSYYLSFVIVLSCFHHRTIMLSSSHYGGLTIILTCYHHRTIAFRHTCIFKGVGPSDIHNIDKYLIHQTKKNPYSLIPLRHMPILDFSNSAANKDMMTKNWTKWGYNYLLQRKYSGKMRNCSLQAISPFPTMFSEAVC